MDFRKDLMAHPKTLGDAQMPLREQVLEEMRRRVVSGTYSPGERLTEERLCEDFGVSRSPVREALRALEYDGFVERQPRRGVVVATPDVERISDLLAFRSSLESLAAKMAALRADEQDIENLRTLLDESATATERGELDRVAELNSALHMAVLRASRIPWLASVAVPLYLHVHWVFRFTAAEARAALLARAHPAGRRDRRRQRGGRRAGRPAPRRQGAGSRPGEGRRRGLPRAGLSR
ncbi:hypothetical protein BJF82_03160 [Kytococcus sp. CUA-901]|nr:hypothetical protein BJF82_03160 [Kytococcus sp. CUA-901]